MERSWKMSLNLQHSNQCMQNTWISSNFTHQIMAKFCHEIRMTSWQINDFVTTWWLIFCQKIINRLIFAWQACEPWWNLPHVPKQAFHIRWTIPLWLTTRSRWYILYHKDGNGTKIRTFGDYEQLILFVCTSSYIKIWWYRMKVEREGGGNGS